MNIRITAEAVRQYALASKDMAAIHISSEAAAEAGYERPIAHGMFLMGLAQSLYLSKHQTA
jgi:acyl dehydratase